MYGEVQLQYWLVSYVCKLKIYVHKWINYVKIWTLEGLTEQSHGHKDEHGQKDKKERKRFKGK